MVNGQAGKGDTYRKVDKEQYDRGYLRVFGKKCSRCKGTGWIPEYDPELGALQGVQIHCPRCKGIGYFERVG